MSSIVQLIQAYCPGLYDDTNRDIYITTAQSLTSSYFFGTNYNYAVCLRAAHNWTMFNRPGGSIGAGGGINNLKEGDLSIGFSAGNINDDLDQTSYGRQLKSLINSSVPGISVTGSSVSELQT